jgi:hypothetical protein
VELTDEGPGSRLGVRVQFGQPAEHVARIAAALIDR